MPMRPETNPDPCRDFRIGPGRAEFVCKTAGSRFGSLCGIDRFQISSVNAFERDSFRIEREG